jgi:TolB-like protein
VVRRTGSALGHKIFEFAGLTLDIARGTLRAVDGDIELRPKSFAVLLYLVEHADRLVTKEELVRAIWSEVIVSDEALTHCISEVRNAIGDAQQQIIKTIPRRGYRFAAHVSWSVVDQVQPLESSSVAPPRLSAAPGTDRKPEPTLPDRPSIVVLPFKNMSGDPEQDYFADGVVEEIITALSRFSGLFVIARNSSFTLKGRAVDVKDVGRTLGVRYVLEGSVRKTPQRVRITGQLVDSVTGAHLWADRFDGALDDVLDLQDHLTASVVNAIAPKLEQAEIDRAKRKPTDSLDAYDHFLRGMEKAYLDTQDAVAEALRLFSKSIELDVNYAAACAMAAYCYVLRKASRWMSDQKWEVVEGARLAWQAMQGGKDDALALSRAGHALAYLVREFDAAAFCIDRALVLNPNLASAWFASAWLRVRIGEPDVAIKHFSQFKRMSPLDPLMPVANSGSSFAYLFSGRYDDALSEAEQALQESPNLHLALRASVAANVLAGRTDRAQTLMARLRHVDPVLRMSNLEDVVTFRPEDLGKFAEALRIAGLPE